MMSDKQYQRFVMPVRSSGRTRKKFAELEEQESVELKMMQVDKSEAHLWPSVRLAG